MFEVLVYVYENYWQGDACPEPRQLGRKLSAAGFEAEEIEAALTWLSGLQFAARSSRGLSLSDSADDQATDLVASLPAAATSFLKAQAFSADTSGESSKDKTASLAVSMRAQSADSLRVYSVAEQEHLGAQSLGFVSFLESAGVLPPAMREIVMDRAMAAPGEPLSLDDLKIIVLMVYWSVGAEPDALVLDELCDESEGRVAH